MQDIEPLIPREGEIDWDDKLGTLLRALRNAIENLEQNGGGGTGGGGGGVDLWNGTGAAPTDKAIAAASAVRTSGNQDVSGLKNFLNGLKVPTGTIEQAWVKDLATALSQRFTEAQLTPLLAVAKDRGSHTGSQEISTIIGLENRLLELAGKPPVVEKPIAEFSMTTSLLGVSVDGRSSTPAAGKTLVDYRWSMGDGTILQGPGPLSHTYAAAGIYEVALTVTDNTGESSTRIQQATIVAPSNVKPTASFVSTAENLVVFFNAGASIDPDGSITGYAWTLGDGTSKTGVTTTHTYAAGGTYTVGLTVTDDKNETHSTVRTITVAPAGGSNPTGTQGVNHIWVEGATPSATANAWADAMIARGATLQRVKDNATNLQALASAPNTTLVLGAGTSTANLTTSVLPWVKDHTGPVVVFNHSFVDDIGLAGATTDTSNVGSIYVAPANVGKVTSAGLGSGSHAIASLAAIANWALPTAVSAAAEITLHRSSSLGGTVEFILEPGDLDFLGAPVDGWRAAASFWRDSTTGYTATGFDFGYALLVAAATAARSSSPAGLAAPTITRAEQTSATSTGAIITTEYSCDADADLLLFEVSSYSTNGGLPYATLAANQPEFFINGDPTKRRRVSTPRPFGTAPEYWARQAKDLNADGVKEVSGESAHRQVSAVNPDGGGPVSTTIPVSLLPFDNRKRERYEVYSTDYVATKGTPPLIWPIWTAGLAENPTWQPVDSEQTISIRQSDHTAWFNQTEYSHNVRYSTENDPYVLVTDRKDNGRSVYAHVPLDLVAVSGSDAHAHVVQPDGTHILEMIGFQRDATDPSLVSGSTVHLVDLEGAGMGPKNGVRAYGGSAVGGLIRQWEVDPANPYYTGKIDHPLAVAVSKYMLKSVLDTRYDRWGWHASGKTDEIGQPGWPVGIRRGGRRDVVNASGGYFSLGFMRRVHPWPATEEDYDAGTVGNYVGANPMGTLLGIPWDVTPASLGINMNPQRQLIWDALREYGARITDTNRATKNVTFYIDAAATSDFRNALKTVGGSSTYPEITKMVRALRVVNETWDNPGGGPFSAPRRGRPVHSDFK